MDAIGSFLKTALYRVIFVFIVGIPTVELFSFAILGNGILIEKVDERTIPANVKLRFDNPTFRLPYGDYGKIPGNMGISEVGTKNGNNYPVEIDIPNADIRLYRDDATLRVENGNLLTFNGVAFQIRELPTSGWVLYLTLAWILGEILCFVGEFFIGLALFGWRPCECGEEIEKVCPKEKTDIIQLNVENGTNSNIKLYISCNDKNFQKINLDSSSKRTISIPKGVKCILGFELNHQRQTQGQNNKFSLEKPIEIQRNLTLKIVQPSSRDTSENSTQTPPYVLKINDSEEIAFREENRNLEDYLRSYWEIPAPYLKVSHFVNNNETILEMSEVHFVISRVLAGFGVLTLGIFLILLKNKVFCDLSNKDKLFLFFWVIFMGFLWAVIVFLNFTWIKLLLVVGGILLLGVSSTYAAIIYRIHANKLLYYSRSRQSQDETTREET